MERTSAPFPRQEWARSDDATLNASRPFAGTRRLRDFAFCQPGPVVNDTAVRQRPCRDLRFSLGARLPARLGRAEDEHGAGHGKSRKVVARRRREWPEAAGVD